MKVCRISEEFQPPGLSPLSRYAVLHSLWPARAQICSMLASYHLEHTLIHAHTHTHTRANAHTHARTHARTQASKHDAAWRSCSENAQNLEAFTIFNLSFYSLRLCSGCCIRLSRPQIQKPLSRFAITASQTEINASLNQDSFQLFRFNFVRLVVRLVVAF